MAQINNTVDPNDLDSIDALLDEAEIDAVIEEPISASASKDASVSDEGLGGGEEELSETWPTDEDEASGGSDSVEGLLDDLDDDLESIGVEATPQKPAEPEVPKAVEPKKEVDAQPKSDYRTEEKVLETSAEEILEKRAQAQKNAIKPNKGGDMDAIKKLIIIFSSVTITLVVAAIGIGIWGALSAGKGMSEETLAKIDGIEANSTQALVHSNASEKTLQTLDKKLDAVSFQIEQLNGDLSKIAMPTPVVDKKTAEPPVAEKAAVIETKEIKLTPEMAIKMDKVSAQMNTAQRRLYEVNERVKSLQVQYKQLLKSIKLVEKQLVQESVNHAVPATSKSKQKPKSSIQEVPNAQSISIPGTAKPTIAPPLKTAPPLSSVPVPSAPAQQAKPVQPSPYQYRAPAGGGDLGGYSY